MKKGIVIALFCLITAVCSADDEYTMAPDGSFVSGNSFVMAPYGTFVGSDE